jgi:exonuclease-1
MGIQGLLKELSSTARDRRLSEISGLRVAIDGYVWLHRGIFFGAADIAKGERNTSYVQYFENRIRQLLRYDSSNSHYYP